MQLRNAGASIRTSTHRHGDGLRVAVSDVRSCRRPDWLAALSLWHQRLRARSPPPPATGLTVVVRPGPATWFPGPTASRRVRPRPAHRVSRASATLPLNVVVADGAAALLAQVAARRGARRRRRPVPPRRRRSAASASDARAAVDAPATHAVEPVLIYNRDGYQADDAGATSTARRVALSRRHRARRAARDRPRRASGSPVGGRSTLPSADALIAQVSDGTIDYAIVAVERRRRRAQHLSRLRRRVSGRAASASSRGRSRPARGRCATSSTRSSRALRDDGTLARLRRALLRARRATSSASTPACSSERIASRCCRNTARCSTSAQEATGIEWRLLAAIAYQESQWDPYATSETGVRGLMQITEDTARHLGVADRLDAQASCVGAARYLRDLKAKLPARIPEPDRTWLALAAFNIGLGHLEDARDPRAEAEAQSGLVERREQGAAAARAARVLRATRSTATRAAACRSRSSTACAPTTTSCCAPSSPRPAAAFASLACER